MPLEIFLPFRGGIYDRGSICGALPPAIITLALVTDTETNRPLIEELMALYSTFQFPEYQPAGMDLPTTVANSTLCHVSLTRWMNSAGFKRKTPERSERCAGVVADVCKYTVKMLNKLADQGAFAASHAPAAIVGDCMTCHQEEAPYAHGKESCIVCHGDPHN